MNYLSIENLSKYYGEKLLFDHVSFGVDKGQKIALIAKNGMGKTTLLNIIMGKDIPDNGKITLRGDIRVGYLPQLFDNGEDNSVFDAIFESDNQQVKAVKAYESALIAVQNNPNEENNHRLQLAIDAMDTNKAWDFEAKAKEVLHRFAIDNYFQNMQELSGGQRKKVALAKLLLSDADFFILDEPTNHLDIEMIEWLENFLSTSNTTLLMVTHDRFFLDKVCNEIIELSPEGVFRYRGNYNYFLEKKQERLDNQAAEMEKLKNIYHKELEWIRSTPQARSTKAKARIDNFENIKEQLSNKIEFKENTFAVKTERIGNKILEINNLDFSYEDNIIVKDFSYIFKKGERCGIVGKNGSGKTTFLKLLVNELKPIGGKITFGQTIIVGYYSQDELSSGNDGKRVIDIVKEHAEMVRMANGNLLSASAFLNHFGFTHDLQYTFYENLSGGQRRKLHLLMVLLKNPNFLILDEPTNDFDIDTLNILEDFLLSFEGCLLVVSHDRWFMNKLVDHIFIMEENGYIKDYYGTYSHYKESKQKEQQLAKRQQKVERSTNIVQKPKSTNPNKRSYKEEQEFISLEKEIETLENDKQTILNQLNSNSFPSEELLKLSKQYQQIDQLLEEKTMRWLVLSEKDSR